MSNYDQTTLPSGNADETYGMDEYPLNRAGPPAGRRAVRAARGADADAGYAMLDLESELTASGLFRHETKRRYTQARTLVAQAHGIAWSMLRKIDDRAARQYNDKTDEAYRTISGCILLEAPQRSYNIVLSLCRIISSLNGRISGRYDFNPAKPLVRIPALLECTGIEDYRIDEIIELNLTD